MEEVVLAPAPFSVQVLQGNISVSAQACNPLSIENGCVDRSYQEVALQQTTLDEPVLTTVLRDLKMILNKTKKVVLLSKNAKHELENWDLWGPLFICLALGTMLSIDESGDSSNNAQGLRPAEVFSTLMMIMWLGAIVVTINSKLLGGHVSFFQNMCLLGYCLTPMLAATAFCMLVHLLLPDVWFSCSVHPPAICNNTNGCLENNFTNFVGNICKGWNDQMTCSEGELCNVLHSNIVNFILRFVASTACFLWSLRSSLGFLSEVVKPERRELAAYPVFLFYVAITWFVMLRTSSS